MCNCALELTLRRRSQFWHSQQPCRTTGSGAGKCSSTPASEPDYSRQTTTQRGRVGPANPRVPASWRADRVNAGDFIIPLEGEASLWASQRCRARCLLLGRALRTIVESDSTVRPLTKSSNTTVFCYLLKWIHFFFFFSNSSGTLIFLNRILNRNPIWEG